MTIVSKSISKYKTCDLSVKEHELAKKRNEDEPGLKELQFSDLKEYPLGSVPSILFWNDQQREIYTRVIKRQHTLLKGDYGTGRVELLLSSALIEELFSQARP